jgi:hypothetical protein
MISISHNKYLTPIPNKYRCSLLSRLKPILVLLAVFVAIGNAAADCDATIRQEGHSDESVTFKISVFNCPNSTGSYDFTVHYLEPNTGKRADKTWTRGWQHVGNEDFNVTEFPSKSSDEIVDKIDGESISRCTCNS